MTEFFGKFNFFNTKFVKKGYTSCSPAEIGCAIDSECLPISKKCDGVKQCKDGSDEKFCEAGILFPTKSLTNSQVF